MTASNEREINLSIIVPVYNRPTEVDELLKSLSNQTNKNFEVIIVEDGSNVKCDKEVGHYKSFLDLKYYHKENTGPGLTRNYGSERATGNYFIYLDSDCVLPTQYIQTVQDRLTKSFVDAFGGPDKADQNFSILQKSINYAMTSFLTTGGIRGGGDKLEKFHPRSFNMGISKEVFEKTGGFPSFRFAKNKAAGEDIDLSIQINKLGFRTELIKEAFVYHKRRTSFKQFLNQVYNFGFARVSIYKRHPSSLKLVHAFPSMFLVGVLFLVISSIFISPYFITPLIVYTLLLFVDSSIRNKNVYVGLNSISACYIQLMGYGAGFLVAFSKRT